MCSPRDPPSTPRNSSYRNSHGRPHGPGTGPSPAARRSRKKHWNHPKLSREGTGGPTNAGSDQGRHSALCGDGPGTAGRGLAWVGVEKAASRHLRMLRGPDGKKARRAAESSRSRGPESRVDFTLKAVCSQEWACLCVCIFTGEKKNGRVNRFCRIHVSA